MGHSSVPVGLFSEKSTPYSFLQNARPPGSLRSPSELRAETFFQKVPVFRMAYSAPTAHCAVSSETLMLQPLRGLRTPHRPIVSLYFSPKRTTFRFASLTLRTAHRPPVSSPLAAAAALWLPCVRGAVRRRAGLRGCLRVRVKGKGRRPSPVSAPNRLFKPLRCFARLIRQAETLDLQPLRGLHRSTLCFFFQNAHAPGSLRSPSVCAPKPSFRRFRCFAWLILRFRTIAHTGAGVPPGLLAPPNAPASAASRPPSKRTALSSLKRSCFSRFAASEPRTALPFLLH